MSGRPHVAARFPEAAQVAAGEKRLWCACGRSGSQAWCDGKGHVDTGIAPLAWTAPATRRELFCCCKQTRSPPYCDGSHRRIREP